MESSRKLYRRKRILFDKYLDRIAKEEIFIAKVINPQISAMDSILFKNFAELNRWLFPPARMKNRTHSHGCGFFLG